MSRPKVGGIGAFIVVAFILCAVATFTDNWITWNNGFLKGNIGIVPYRGGYGGWFSAASWMMFISFALFFPLIALYLHAGYNVHHHGCGHSIRHNFNGISLICAIIVVLEAVAFILMAVNASDFSINLGSKYLSINASIGSSAYLALTSAIIATIAMALSGHVSRHHCH